MTLELAALTLELVELAEARLETLAPMLGRVDEEAPVHTTGDDDSTGQLFPELRRQGEPVLVVNGVLVLAEEHDLAIPDLPLSPTLDHDSPLCKGTTSMISRCSKRLPEDGQPQGRPSG